MQSPVSTKNRRSSLAALGAVALAGALALTLTACGDDATSDPAVDPNAMITLTKPKGGEVFKVGDSLRVNWTVKADPADPITAVDVVFSPDSGLTWVYLPWGPEHRTTSISSTSPYWSNVAWQVPESLYVPTLDAKIKISGSHRCLIRVEDYVNSDASRKATTASFITINP